MKLITSLFAKIRAFFGSIAQPAAPVATTTAPHIRMLLLHLCDQDAAKATWVARWLAYPLRHPGAKMATAMLVAGAQGAGKSLFFERVVGPMYGTQAQFGGSNLLRSVFNEWTIGKRYAVLSDLGNADIAAGALKNLIASGELAVHRKGLPDIAIANGLNLVLMTNDDVNAAALASGRRTFLLDPQHRLPVELATAVMREIENGGLVEFHQYLTHELDMADFDQYASTSYAMESAVAA